MNLYFRLLRMILTSTRKRDRGLWDTAVTRWRVQLTDLDAVGHMNNAKYLALMDLGRVDMMMRSGLWKQAQDRGWYMVVAAQTIRYRRSLQPRQRFELHTRIIGTDAKAMYMEQAFRVGADLYAHAVVQVRVLRKEGGSVDSTELLETIGEPPHPLELPAWVEDWAKGVREAR